MMNDQGASVLYVASLLSVPTILLKVVTDVVDGERPTSEEYLENLTGASLTLHEASLQILDFIHGKACTDL
jgi:5'-methylthioadenosine nucleosidase